MAVMLRVVRVAGWVKNQCITDPKLFKRHGSPCVSCVSCDTYHDMYTSLHQRQKYWSLVTNPRPDYVELKVFLCFRVQLLVRKVIFV